MTAALVLHESVSIITSMDIQLNMNYRGGAGAALAGASGSGQVYGHAVVGCEDADGCGRVLRHQGVDLGVGAPRVVVE